MVDGEGPEEQMGQGAESLGYLSSLETSKIARGMKRRGCRTEPAAVALISTLSF